MLARVVRHDLWLQMKTKCDHCEADVLSDDLKDGLCWVCRQMYGKWPEEPRPVVPDEDLRTFLYGL